MMQNNILEHLPQGHPWRGRIHCHDTLPSTNSTAKELAMQGAPAGTIVIADSQSAGRGRLGRQFSSPGGQGLYFSCILRPNCPAQQLMHLTCAVAVAAANAVEAVTGLRPGIKWTNDLVVGSKKLGGILTELSLDIKTGLVDFAVIGIGINCLQGQLDFDESIRSIACSLAMVTGQQFSPAQLAAALMVQLESMADGLLTQRGQIMALYRRDCVTIGKQVSILRGDEVRHGLVLALQEDGALVIEYDDGTQDQVTSGEVSIRGMYGYL